MIALGFLIAWVIKAAQTSMTKPASETATQSVPEEEAPLVQLDKELVPLNGTTLPEATDGTLTSVSAQKLIESWLTAKSAAMGPEHSTDTLDQILVDPKLSEWRGAALDAKQSGAYRKYKHAVKVNSVEQSQEGADQARVLAEVSESTEYYEGDQLQNTKSDPELRIQYDLVKVDNQWRIQNWQLVQ